MKLSPCHARTPRPSPQPSRCKTACCRPWEKAVGLEEASEGRTDEQSKGGEASG